VVALATIVRSVNQNRPTDRSEDTTERSEVRNEGEAFCLQPAGPLVILTSPVPREEAVYFEARSAWGIVNGAPGLPAAVGSPETEHLVGIASYPIFRDKGQRFQQLALELELRVLPAPLACCRSELERRHLMPPSNIALRIVVEEDTALVRALNRAYADAAPDGGLEANERDALLDIVGRHFIGRPLPRSGGIEASRRFWADLQRAMIKAGWRVDLFAAATWGGSRPLVH
jgi:hypothetical protein